MTTSVEQEAANIMLPLLNKTGQLVQGSAASTTTTAAFDLQSLTAGMKGHFFTLHADAGDVYVAVSQANSDTIDPAANGVGVTVCQRIPSGQSISGRLPAVDSPGSNPYRYVLHRTGTGTAQLRVCITSIGHSEDDRALKA